MSGSRDTELLAKECAALERAAAAERAEARELPPESEIRGLLLRGAIRFELAARGLDESHQDRRDLVVAAAQAHGEEER